MTLVISLIAILFFASFMAGVFKMGQLNLDPLQESLARAISEMIAAGQSSDSRRAFTEVAGALFYKFRVTDPHQVRVRLGHALSMIMREISRNDLVKAQRFFDGWKLPRREALHAHTTSIETLNAMGATGNADVFVSYAREDQDAARVVVARLRAEGFSVWWDDRIDPGAGWERAIQAALRNAKATLVLWSPMASVSEWVRSEAAYAKNSERMVPVFIRKCRLPDAFSEMQTVDLSEWSGERSDFGWRSVVEMVQELCASAQSPII